MSTSEQLAIAPGSRWVRRGGVHDGLQVTVVRTTNTGVVVRRAKGTGAGSIAGDQSQEHRVDIEAFGAEYVPYSGTNGTVGTARRFRRTAAPKAAPAEKPHMPVVPAAGVLSTGGTELAIEVLTITPDMAAAWLARGGLNRNLRKRWVDQLANAIRRGEWCLTADTIKLDSDGMVRDGQHRLHAIVQAGVPVQSLVVRGVAEAAFDVMDTGRPRGVKDILGMHGYTSRVSLGGAARVLLIVERFGRLVPGGEDYELTQTLVTPSLILAYIAEHPELADGVRLGDAIRVVLMGGNAIWATAMTMLLRVDPAQAAEFAELLKTGAGMEIGHPALALRNRLTARNAYESWTRDQRVREELLAMIIKAWNAWRRKEHVQSLRWRDSEGFPVPV